MKNNFKIVCKSPAETKKIAQNFVKLASANGAFVSLYGEIGAGKTAFVKFAAEALGVKERVTSPSFVILNEYHSAKLPIYHFDLYRLENEGVKSILDELREYSQGKILTFVEWAEFSEAEIPFNHIEINVAYKDNNDTREYFFKPYGENNIKIIDELKREFDKGQK